MEATTAAASRNAGLRLWDAQKQQGTGLCIGLDPHFDPSGALNGDFYRQFAQTSLRGLTLSVANVVDEVQAMFSGRHVGDPDDTIEFLCGVIQYYCDVVNYAWQNGIRVFKPQSAFYERFGFYGSMVLAMVVQEIDMCSARDKQPAFKILDAKRGDIDSTQSPYYGAYLSDKDEEVIPGMLGCFGFDAMTITSWMGEDVLTPGLPLFKRGKGAIVVTRSSNPSGTTFQDLQALFNPQVELSDKQKPFRIGPGPESSLEEILGRTPMVHEYMLDETERFCDKHGLNQDGVSPIFSVMGSTVKMDGSFRKIRPGGIALVPGFGAQGGNFDNVMPLAVKEGPLAGHVGILSSSRDHNFPWLERCGGKGNPKQLKGEMARAIDGFRIAEREAYANAGVDYPF